MPDPITIRPCEGHDELTACVQLQIDVWGYGDRDVVPRRVFLVGQKIGGQVIGAFDGDTLVGFAMALPGLSVDGPYLHSHMLAVNPAYRDQGIGRRLKLFQREEALTRDITRMEWTFDPLEIKNAFLNICRLGAIVRRYIPNFYGVTSSPLHGSVPTDRLCAEWWLKSCRVDSVLNRKPVTLPLIEQEIQVPHEIGQWRHSPQHQDKVLEVQTRNRNRLQQAFDSGLTIVAFKLDPQGNGLFQLGTFHED